MVRLLLERGAKIDARTKVTTQSVACHHLKVLSAADGLYQRKNKHLILQLKSQISPKILLKQRGSKNPPAAGCLEPLQCFIEDSVGGDMKPTYL